MDCNGHAISREFYERMEGEFDKYKDMSTILKDKKLLTLIGTCWQR